MQFKGTGVALITPFKENKQVDFNTLKKLVDFHIENGTDFIVVQGTTGEAATLTEKEKQEVLETVITQNNGQLPIVHGLAGNNTAAVAKEMEAFNQAGVDGFLSASPHYNKPSQEGIFKHFETLANHSKKPIILYNVPGRTGSNMSAETTLRLAEIENIVAVKEASGDLEQVMQIIKNAPQDFAVLSGEDALTLPIIALGGHGVISVVANAFPADFSTMITATKEMKLEKARDLHYQLIDITNSFFEEGNPSGVKYGMQLLALSGETVRLPLTSISTSLKKKMQMQMDALQRN